MAAKTKMGHQRKTRETCRPPLVPMLSSAPCLKNSTTQVAPYPVRKFGVLVGVQGNGHKGSEEGDRGNIFRCQESSVGNRFAFFSSDVLAAELAFSIAT